MGFFDIFKKKKKTESVEQNALVSQESATQLINGDASADNALNFLIEEITAIQVRESSLIEITDSGTLAQISKLLPVMEVGKTATDVAQQVAAKAEPLYRVILKKGGELVDSRNTVGAKRAITMGAKGIQENAELMQVNGFVSGGTLTSAGVGVMNIASMIVMQYCMQQIDGRIRELQAGVEMIIDFIDVQYKSKVITLLESILSITKFQAASIENKEVRNRELDNLQQLKRVCLNLLNHAEIYLQKLTAADAKDYDEYIKTTRHIEKWIKFQQILLQLLEQISKLDFTLHIGQKSKEQCYDNLNAHYEQLNKKYEGLIAWHEKQCKVLKIDLTDKRRKNTGFLALLEKPISWINDEWNYQSVDEATVALIQAQSEIKKERRVDVNNIFEQDVQIIVRGDKKYYLPNKADE